MLNLAVVEVSDGYSWSEFSFHRQTGRPLQFNAPLCLCGTYVSYYMQEQDLARITCLRIRLSNNLLPRICLRAVPPHNLQMSFLYKSQSNGIIRCDARKQLFELNERNHKSDSNWMFNSVSAIEVLVSKIKFVSIVSNGNKSCHRYEY